MSALDIFMGSCCLRGCSDFSPSFWICSQYFLSKCDWCCGITQMMRPLRASVLRRVGLLLPRQGWMLAAGCWRSCFCCAKLLMWGRMRGDREREGGRCALSRHGGGGNSHANVSRDCLMLPSDGGWVGVAPTARTARHILVFWKFGYAWWWKHMDLGLEMLICKQLQ